jgi:glutamate-1-semialdehyde 2,1-aminomutase
VVAPYNDRAATIELIRAHADDLAAVIIEPMLGSGGCIPAEVSFLETLREETRQCGAFLVFDEVMTSRLSPGGLQGVYGVFPDLTTLGKYLGGGMSFGAFGGSREIMSRFDPRSLNSFPHAGTFNNNVMTMAAGAAGLAEVYTPEAALALNKRGEALRQRLNSRAESCGAAMQFTGIGSMMTVHMCRGVITSPARAKGNATLRDLFYFDMLEANIWMAKRGMINLSLPLSDEDIAHFESAVDEFIQSRGRLLQ